MGAVGVFHSLGGTALVGATVAFHNLVARFLWERILCAIAIEQIS